MHDDDDLWTSLKIIYDDIMYVIHRKGFFFVLAQVENENKKNFPPPQNIFQTLSCGSCENFWSVVMNFFFRVLIHSLYTYFTHISSTYLQCVCRKTHEFQYFLYQERLCRKSVWKKMYISIRWNDEKDSSAID